MNEIQNFKFNGCVLRTLVIKDDPWFVAKDVCDILESRTNNLRTILEPDEISELSNDYSVDIAKSGGKKPLIISEPGLYKLIMRSRKPQAKAFQRWVTHIVLPAIRKHGAYMTDEKAAAIVTDKGSLADLLQQAAEQLKRKDIQIEQMKPKALFADAVSTSDTPILVGELAKILHQNGVSMGQNRMFRWLRDNGYLISKKGTSYNMPTQRAMELGLFKIKENAITHSDGHVTITKTPKVTGKGQVYFVNKFVGEEGLACRI